MVKSEDSVRVLGEIVLPVEFDDKPQMWLADGRVYVL